MPPPYVLQWPPTLLTGAPQSMQNRSVSLG